MGRALREGIKANLLYGESLGQALKKALAAQLAEVSAECTIQGLKHAAWALADLAFGDFAGAAKHGAASAAFFAVAAAAGAGASSLAKSAGLRGDTSSASAGQAVASSGSADETERERREREAREADRGVIRESRTGGAPDPNVIQQSRNQYAPVPVILHIESTTRNEPGTLTEHIVRVVDNDPRVKVSVESHAADALLSGSSRGPLNDAVERSIIRSYRDNGLIREVVKNDAWS
jgi:hypothetical protein